MISQELLQIILADLKWAKIILQMDGDNSGELLDYSIAELEKVLEDD